MAEKPDDQTLLPLTDWTQHPDTWDAATRERILAVLEAVPSAQELRRLQAAPRAPGGW